MKTLTASLLLTVSALLGPAAQAAPKLSEAQAAELLQKSGYIAQLGQIEAAVVSGLNLTPGLAANIPEADLQIIRASIAAAFAPERLAKDSSQQLPALLAPDAAKTALVWLDTDLGKRITALEDDAAKPEGLEERTAAAEALFKRLPERRIERYLTLARALNAGEASATIAIDTALATARAAATLASASPEENLAEIRKQLEAGRPKMVEQLSAQYLVFFAGAYQTLEDREIDQYTAFSSSPAGAAYTAALARLLDVVMTLASLESSRLITAARAAKPAGV